jgi:hypothetical protein
MNIFNNLERFTAYITSQDKLIVARLNPKTGELFELDNWGDDNNLKGFDSLDLALKAVEFDCVDYFDADYFIGSKNYFSKV